jgi:hypothetical protein
MTKRTATAPPNTSTAVARTSAPNVFCNHSCRNRFGTPTTSWSSSQTNFVFWANQRL